MRMPVYPYATNFFGWSKEKISESNLGINLMGNSPFEDFCFGYEVPETGADSILKFYSNELTKIGWKIKREPETSWDENYQIRSFHAIYTKNPMVFSLWIHVYHKKSSNPYWPFKKLAPTSVRINVYKT
jgi:hypothetical protein